MIAKKWKRKGLFWALFVLAVLLLFGCDFSSRKTIGSGYDVWQFGIVSDTTAMLAVRYWDQFEDNAGDGYDYLGWGLMLVDVRYRHIYREDRMEDRGTMSAAQLTDSTMLLWSWEYNSEKKYWMPDTFWFWKVGRIPSDSVQFNWSIEHINMDHARVLPWTDGKILAISDSYVLLDTSAGIVSRWVPDTVSWVNDCDDVQWNGDTFLCLTAGVGNDSNDVVVYSSAGDTLFHYTFPYSCSGTRSLQFYGDYIVFAKSFFSCEGDTPFSYAEKAVFSFRDSLEPVFWMGDRAAFWGNDGNYTSYYSR